MRATKGLGGDLSAFFDGLIQDAPWDLVSAVNHALGVISWFENLPRDEQPPRHIWWSDQLIDEWFEEVRAKRDSPNKRRKSPYEEAQDVPMAQNELLDKSNLVRRG